MTAMAGGALGSRRQPFSAGKLRGRAGVVLAVVVLAVRIRGVGAGVVQQFTEVAGLVRQHPRVVLGREVLAVGGVAKVRSQLWRQVVSAFPFFFLSLSQ